MLQMGRNCGIGITLLCGVLLFSVMTGCTKTDTSGAKGQKQSGEKQSTESDTSKQKEANVTKETVTEGKESVAATSSDAPKTPETVLHFDEVSVGELPEGWKIEATNPKGPLATWKVIEDATAPSGKQVLALTSPNLTFGGAFNLCWTDKVSFLDGEIEVRFKANEGDEDQGGGVIWRAQDKENYYIARFNPLEDNFRLYTVQNGARKILADAKIELPAGKWHTLKIVQNGDHYEAYLNGKKLLEGTDKLFPKTGGVGLWTKADAATSFDDFTVRPLKP